MPEVTPGVQPLGLTTERDTLLYIPANYTPDQPAALALLLHGAGGVAEYGLSILQGLADEHNLLLLAPASRRQTWDMIVDEYGPDVTLIARSCHAWRTTTTTCVTANSMDRTLSRLK
jgi:poly(3-hydroxybutyrate) depolymerase